MLAANELKKGKIFIENNAPHKVLEYQHKKYGRGQATIKIKAKNLLDGSFADKTFDSGAKLEEAETQKRSAQFTYSDEKKVHFMDMETYDQIALEVSTVPEASEFLTEGQKVVVTYWEDAPINIELPKTVDLKVVEAAPATAGDTAGNATKQVVLETGLEVNVPLFVTTGDVVKVNTDSKSYISRV